MNDDERIPIGNRVTIFQRGKKGTWTADFWFDGEHRRKSLKTSNFKIARDRATKLDAQLQQGEFAASIPKVEISIAIQLYIDYLETENRARKTIVRYRGELTKFSDFCAESRVTGLSQVTPDLFDRYRAHRRNSLKPRSLYHESVVIKQLLNWCVSRGYVAKNSLSEVKLQKPVPTAKAVLSKQQVAILLSKCSGQRQVLLAVLAYTGMRSGELQRLRVGDVNIKDNWIHIVSREGAETKTRHSRKVPIHPDLLPLLRRFRPEKGEWFFTAATSRRYPEGGRPINTKKLNDRMQVSLRKAKLTTGREAGGFTVHSLRHFFETHCVNAGLPQRVVDTWLGHRSDRSMASVYYHLSDEESQRFMRELELPLLSPLNGELK